MPRQPLYPHIPKGRVANNNYRPEGEPVKLRFLPDSPEEISLTVKSIGYEAKLESAFRQAIARANGAR